MAISERYARPQSLSEAVALLSGGGATILAGGTDLMPQTQAGSRAFKPLLLNIGRIAEMRGIAIGGERIRIGALTTVTEILASPLVRERIPVLARAADCFASDQLRNWATLGGNIANASPAGDLIIPLLLLDAELELASQGENGAVETTRMPLHRFFVAPGQSLLEPHQLLTSIEVPLPPSDFVAFFEKFGTRPALDIPAVSIGIAGIRKNGALEKSRVAIGAAAPTPLRAVKTEKALDGRKLDPEGIAAVAETAGGEINPISDVRASAWYRRELVVNLTKRMLAHAAGS